MHRIGNWKEKVEYLGRILVENEIAYINWTDAGLRFSFTGTCLIADLKAICKTEEEMDINGSPTGKSRILYLRLGNYRINTFYLRPNRWKLM